MYVSPFYSPATSYSHRGKPPITIGAEELNFRVRPSACDERRISSSSALIPVLAYIIRCGRRSLVSSISLFLSILSCYICLHSLTNIIDTIKKDETTDKCTFHLFTARRRPTLTGGSPQLPLALKSLTSVFGMGTGVTSSLSSPDYRFVITIELLCQLCSLSSSCTAKVHSGDRSLASSNLLILTNLHMKFEGNHSLKTR